VPSNQVYISLCIASLVLSACLPDRQGGNSGLDVSWCQVSGDGEIEIYLGESPFSDVPVVQEYDLTYQIEFCGDSSRCIADPVIVDFDALENSVNGNWCEGQVCFQLVRGNVSNNMTGENNIVSSWHSEYEIHSDFEFDHTGAITKLSFFGSDFEPCRVAQ